MTEIVRHHVMGRPLLIGTTSVANSESLSSRLRAESIADPEERGKASADIDEMEKAFNWNQSQSNAFAHLKDDAQAPWGAVAKELARSVPELVKAGIRATTKEEDKPRSN